MNYTKEERLRLVVKYILTKSLLIYHLCMDLKIFNKAKKKNFNDLESLSREEVINARIETKQAKKVMLSKEIISKLSY